MVQVTVRGERRAHIDVVSTRVPLSPKQADLEFTVYVTQTGFILTIPMPWPL